MPRDNRESPRDRRLRQQALQTEIQSQRQNSRSAQQSALVSQLRDLYNISQESQLTPEKLRAGQIANARAQTELDLLPEESASRLRAQDAQTDYYGIRNRMEGRADLRDIAPFVGAKGELPDWVLPYLPPDVQEGVRSANAAKAAERAAAIAREERIAAGGGAAVAPVTLPPNVPDNPAGRLGNAVRGALNPPNLFASDTPSMQGNLANAPSDFVRGLGVEESTLQGINETLGNIGSAPAEGLLFYLQKLGVSPETLRSWGLAR